MILREKSYDFYSNFFQFMLDFIGSFTVSSNGNAGKEHGHQKVYFRMFVFPSLACRVML